MGGLLANLAIGLALGVGTELVARLLSLWTYRSPALPVLNVVVMFGLVQGVAVAGLIGGARPLVSMAPVLFMAGALIGLAYEGYNHFSLRAWTWPTTPLLGVSRAIDKTALVGVAWGAVPVLIAALAGLPVIARSFVG